MTLSERDGFRVESRLDDAVQVRAAVAYAAKTLEQIGLSRTKHKGLKILLEQDAVQASGGYGLEIIPAKRLITVRAGDAEGGRCGLYAALEALGVRWFSPAEEPVLPALPLELSAFRKNFIPSFSYRGLHICGGSHHYDEPVAQWMSRLKMNRKLAHPGEIAILRNELAGAGLQPDTTVHSFSDWIPEKTCFQTHPEWFALVGGKRIRHSAGGQLCLANREMCAAFAAKIASFLDAHPEVAIIGICPQDGCGWCECDACRALDTADDRRKNNVNGRVADFTEDICGRVRMTHPSVLVGNYSYGDFSDFPLLREKLPDNLLLSGTMFRCFRHAIDDPACPVNKPRFERLSRLAGKVRHLYAYEYYAYRWGSFPAPFWRVVARDMAAYGRLGMSGFLSEVGDANNESWKSLHLPLYVAARCLYDVRTDVDAVLDDYCAKRFGHAARALRAYLDALEAAWETMPGCGVHDPDEFDRFFTPAVREKCGRLLEQALQTAPAEPFHHAVMSEKALFDEWRRIAEERPRYRISGAVQSLPMVELSLEAVPNPACALNFTEYSTLVPPDSGRTRLWTYADGTRLGFLIDCAEERMEKLVVQEGNTVSAVYGSDSLEVFLAARPGAKVCYHILVNAGGFHVASECQGKRWNWSWEGKYTAAARRLAGGWRIVLTIPKASIGVQDGFCFTVARNRHASGQWILSGVPHGGVFFDTSRYLEVR
jgi:hypothetical protein